MTHADVASAVASAGAWFVMLMMLVMVGLGAVAVWYRNAVGG